MSLFSVWTAKAGAGATTISIGLAARLARRQAVLLVDLGGDLPAAFGLSEPALGVTDWLASDVSDAEALARLEVEVDERLSILPLGAADRWDDDRVVVLRHLLAADDRAVVIDVGCVEARPVGELAWARAAWVQGDGISLLVLRPTYLALRRAHGLPVTPTGVVLVEESGRSLTPRDVEALVGAPVLARVGLDASITRAIDGGVALRRMPRPFTKALGGVA